MHRAEFRQCAIHRCRMDQVITSSRPYVSLQPATKFTAVHVAVKQAGEQQQFCCCAHSRGEISPQLCPREHPGAVHGPLHIPAVDAHLYEGDVMTFCANATVCTKCAGQCIDYVHERAYPNRSAFTKLPSLRSINRPRITRSGSNVKPV